VSQPIVWSIAGSDSGGGAGIQADLLTFAALGVHGCTVLTASTAQNSYAVDHIHYLPADHVKQQLATLARDLPAQAIKLGMPGSIETQQVISEFLAQFNGAIICDPVCVATCHAALTSEAILQHLIDVILPQVDLLTPNLNEAEKLLGIKIHTPAETEAAARALQALGPRAILLKGGHSTTTAWAQDYYFDGQQGFWLQQQRINSQHTHGSGCSLAAAIAAALAKGYSNIDSLVLAKAHVYQGIRSAQAIGQGPGSVRHHPWPCTAADFPWLSTQPLPQLPKPIFPDCGAQPLGLYPIVDNLASLQSVLQSGATCAH
jgi:hydroxymethylpyrimidine kinase / phosphomethylpyrimidine kinase / thiamine-phosphate diphosphorylase